MESETKRIKSHHHDEGGHEDFLYSPVVSDTEEFDDDTPWFDDLPSIKLAQSESLLGKILRIHVITDQLWSYLTWDQLKSCRCVSVAWKQSVTAEMSRRNVSHIQFSRRRQKPSSSFRLSRWWPEAKFKLGFPPLVPGIRGGHRLKHLTALLTRGRELAQKRAEMENPFCYTFPCSSFAFTDGDLNTAEDVKAFFVLHGELVRSLRFERVQLPANVLNSLFTEQLITLRKLSLVSVKLDLNHIWELAFGDDSRSSVPWTLPNLTHVYLEGSSSHPPLLYILIKIMRSAPNLKVIGNWPLHPEYFTSHSAYPFFYNCPTFLSKLVGLVVTEPWNQTDEGLEFLSQLPVRLQILTLDNPTDLLTDPEEVYHLVNILKQSNLSLTVLHMNSTCRLFALCPDLTSTLVLPNVKHLTMDVGKEAGEQFDSTILLAIFPNLRSIYLRFVPEVIFGREEDEKKKMNWTARWPNNKEMTWSHYFIPAFASTSSFVFPFVKNLEILGSVPECWYKRFCKIFPKLRNLTIHGKLEPGQWCADGKDCMWEDKQNCKKDFSIRTKAAAIPVRTRHETFVLSLRS